MLAFAEGPAAALEPGAGTTLVLDPAWTPGPGDRDDVRPVRHAVDAVLARANVVDESLALLDRWADAAGLAEILTIDGVGWWPRIRMAVRWDAHELLLWRLTLDALLEETPYDRIAVPHRRPRLLAAAGAPLAEAARSRLQEPVVRRTGGSLDRLRAAGAGLGDGIRTSGALRRLARSALDLRPGAAARSARMDRAIDEISGHDAALAVVWAGAFQVIEMAGGQRVGDPHLEPVLDRLAGAGRSVGVVVSGR
jgi:hypothetical protein